MVLEMDLAGFALQEMEIHPLMFLIRTVSMILQTFSSTLHNPSTRHTRANYVGTTLIVVMIIHHSFDQPPWYSIDHEEDLNQHTISDVHDRWDKLNESQNELINMMQSFCEMKELQQLEQATNLSTYTTKPSRHFNSFYNDDDDYDYEESTIPLNEIISQIPPSIAIIPVLPTVEPEDSLIMGNEELSTIPENECNLPSCDDFSPINISEGKSVTFSNPLFNLNDDFNSSDDESLSDEDVLEDNVKIYSNPLFEFDDEYISSYVNLLFDEMLEDINKKNSYVSNLDEPALLVTPLSNANEDECFDPEGNFDEIDAFSDNVTSSNFEDSYYDSKGDVLYLESFLSDDTTPKLPPKVFLDGDPRSLNDINNLKITVKVSTLEFRRIFFPIYVSLPFKDRHYLFFTYVI
uniref:Uncharacterized protein n=1 Tax=Tanacetum cinerariifolium TaxID=118510 RepID=A0A6L2J6R6_TANCI|nr:hypothetical protein [Tanacetum cinerariifolium]